MCIIKHITIQTVKTKMCVVHTLLFFLIFVEHLVYIWHMFIHPALETTVLNDNDCDKGAKTLFCKWLLSKTITFQYLFSYIYYSHQKSNTVQIHQEYNTQIHQVGNT